MNDSVGGTQQASRAIPSEVDPDLRRPLNTNEKDAGPGLLCEPVVSLNLC